jgi:hypothetical protein
MLRIVRKILTRILKMRRENRYLRAVMEEKNMTAINITKAAIGGPGPWILHFQGGMLPLLADQLAEYFKLCGGKNFIECTGTHMQLGDFILTIRHRAGKTPNQRRLEAEGESAKLKRRLFNLSEEYRRVSIDNGETCAKLSEAYKQRDYLKRRYLDLQDGEVRSLKEERDTERAAREKAEAELVKVRAEFVARNFYDNRCVALMIDALTMPHPGDGRSLPF